MHTLDSHVVELHLTGHRYSYLPSLGTHTEFKYKQISLEFCAYILWILKLKRKEYSVGGL